MRRNYIAATDHEVTGELGWKDKRIGRHTPYGPISYPVGLAHDALEHFGLETVADEIKAHAVIHWGRYRGGWCDEYGRNLDLDSIASEWIQLYSAIQSGNPLARPPRTLRLDQEVEEDISTIMAEGKRLLRSEFGSESRPLSIEIAEAFRGWFRIGYRQAEAYFWKRLAWSPAELGYHFTRLAEDFSRYAPEFEGQELSLTIDKNGIRLREIELEVY